MIGNDWDIELQNYFASAQFDDLMDKVKSAYKNGACFPPLENIFDAYEQCAFSEVKVVIVGQDPYHTPNVADGKCFSTGSVKTPPSLLNIFKCIDNDYPEEARYCKHSNDLSNWAKQGVFLLNTLLSVQSGKPLSHANFGWEHLINATLAALNGKGNIVFMLWGDKAKNLLPYDLRNPGNLYLESSHPSPLSAYRGFLTCGHFRSCNTYLVDNGLTPIKWIVE